MIMLGLLIALIIAILIFSSEPETDVVIGAILGGALLTLGSITASIWYDVENVVFEQHDGYVVKSYETDCEFDAQTFLFHLCKDGTRRVTIEGAKVVE